MFLVERGDLSIVNVAQSVRRDDDGVTIYVVSCISEAFELLGGGGGREREAEVEDTEGVESGRREIGGRIGGGVRQAAVTLNMGGRLVRREEVDGEGERDRDDSGRKR